jgi:hypothetical protein
MATIVYGGVKYTQVRNAIYCKRCLVTIESTYANDFKMCSCGLVGIDGGLSGGGRILGNLADMENRSLYKAVVNGKKLWLPLSAYPEYK